MPVFFPSWFHAITAGTLLLTAAAPAPASATQRDPTGLAALAFRARNQGPSTMNCTVETAHWYTVDLGTARPGSQIARTFWVVPSTGEVDILGPRHDRMPVASLWCGISGRSWITRDMFPLARRAGTRPTPLRLDCRSDTTLHCEVRRPHPAGNGGAPTSSP